MKDKKQYMWNKRLIYIREIMIDSNAGGWKCNLAICGPRDVQTLFHMERDSEETFNSPLEAEEAALERAIKWVDEFQNEINKIQN